MQWPTVGEKNDDRFALVGARRHPLRSAHGAADQGARVRRAGRRVGVGRTEHVRRCRRVHRDDHAAARPFADRSRDRRRRGDRAAQARRARLPKKCRRRRPAKSCRSCAGSSRTSARLSARQWRRHPRRSRIFPHRVSEDAGGDAGRRAACRQQISDARPHRAERRADGPDRSSVEAGRKHRKSNDPPHFSRCSSARLHVCTLPGFSRTVDAQEPSIAPSSRRSARLPSCAFRPGRKRSSRTAPS